MTAEPVHLENPPEASPYRRHIPALDGVRAFAVAGVMCSHIFPGTPTGPVTRALQQAFTFGAAGVDLFFVLSGFLITGILYDSLQDPAFFRKFYARRTLRIFPLYYGVLAFFFLQTILFGYHFHYELLSTALYLQNTSLIAVPLYAYPGYPVLPISHFWSLAVEEQFYLVWPLLVFLIRSLKGLMIFCVAAIVLCSLVRATYILHGASFFPVNTSTLCRSDSLLAGGLLALLLRSRWHDATLRAAGWFFAACAALTVIFHFAPLSSWGKAHLGTIGAPLFILYSSVLAGMFTGLVALSLSVRTLSNFLGLRFFRWLGKYSYGIYVFHLILFTYLQLPLRAFFAHFTSHKAVNILVSGLTVAAASCLLAFLSFNLYERHFLRLKRYFDYRIHPDTVV